MQKYKSNLTSVSGAAVRGASITVLDESGANASIFLDRAGTLPAGNPLKTAQDGTFEFYAANGRYSLRTDSSGLNVLEEDVILMFDPDDATVSGPIADAIQDAKDAADAAQESADSAKEAADTAQQLADNTVPTFDTYALALTKLGTVQDGMLVEISHDENYNGDRTRYRKVTGNLDFLVNLDQIRIDLADPSKGGSLVAFTQDISGPSDRDVASKAKEALSAYDADGSDGSGAADNTGVLNSLIQQAGMRPINLVGGVFRSNGLINPLGRKFKDGVIRKPDPHGGFVQLNSYTDDGKEFIGAEYLYRVFQRIKQGGMLKAFIYGDSTVATAANGGGYAGPNFTPDVLIPEFLVRKKGIRNNLSFTNRGVGGTRVAQMNAMPDIDTVGGTTDLFAIKYGINDAQDGPEGFAANLDAKLAEIRANPFGTVDNLAIILVGPNSTYDPGHFRSSTWYEQLRGIYVAAARKHKCAFFDTYAYMPDVDWTANKMMDDPFLDGQTVHPTELMQVRIWGRLVDWMFSGSELIPYTSDAWRPLTMLGGWADYAAGGFAPPQASMSIDGWVSIRGLVKDGTVSSGQAIAQLPDPVMFPYVIEMFEVTTATGRCSIRVNTNGNIEQQDANASATYTSLSGIRFKPRG